jgi:hypothetical protein
LANEGFDGRGAKGEECVGKAAMKGGRGRWKEEVVAVAVSLRRLRLRVGYMLM